MKAKEGERGPSSWRGRSYATVTGGQIVAAGSCFLLGLGYLPLAGHPKSSRHPHIQLTISSAAVSVPEAMAEKPKYILVIFHLCFEFQSFIQRKRDENPVS